MLDSLLNRLEKERNVIKGASIHFAAACILSLAISLIICFCLFETALHLDSETIDAYQKSREIFNSSIKASPSQFLQVMSYTNDPTSEKVIPTNTNAPALAYGMDGTKPMFSWDIKSQSWK